MKKKYLLLCGLLVLSLTVGGCGTKTEETQSSSSVTESSETASQETASTVDLPDDYTPPTSLSELTEGLDLDSLVTLGTYKGLDLTKTVEEVTDEDVENAVAEALENNYVEVDRAAESGDVVNIDYVGTLDGEEFSGGSAEGYDLTLGSSTFIDGFEDGLIGAKKGDVVTLNLTFPANYSDELGGKDVVFTVTVNKVQTVSKEISEDWVKENTSFDTVEDYKRDLRVQLETENDSDAEDTMESDAWKMVLENSVVNDYPDAMVQYGVYYYEQIMSSYFTSSGITKEDYLESQGMTEEDYDSLRQSYGQSMAGQLLVMAAIEEAEGISTEDEEYQTSLEELIASAGVTEDVFFSYYSQFSVEQSLMLQRINEIIINNATVTETVASADDSAESSTAQETE